MTNQQAAAFAFMLCSSIAIAQEAAKRLPGDEMIEKYLSAETDKLSKKFMDGAKTLDEWKEKLPRLKREYMDMLGLWPIPEKTPLRATVTGEVEAHGVVVEKLHFQSKPGLYVTANLYRPKVSLSRKRLPAIVYVCGHAGRGRDGNKSAYQEHGFWFANNGYVCITLDTLQLGEIPGVHHGTYGRPWAHLKSYGERRGVSPPWPGATLEETMKDHNRFWWWSAGYTPAGVECWNGIRAIDYLLTRRDVDPDKIGVTGISGGGAATFWIAAADERVKVVVPVSGMSDLEFYVKGKGVNGHCDCMFLYNTYQWDWTTIAALVAPRPLLFANSDNDPIFPMDANRRIIEKLRKCYRMFPKPQGESSSPGGEGAASLVDEYVSTGGHAYRPDLRIAIFKFINKHLKGDTTTPVDDSAKYTPLPGKDLRVFPIDADVPKDAINGRIDETFVARGKVELPQKGKFAEWKAEILIDLRWSSFRPLPQQIDAGETFNDPGLRVITEPGIKAAITLPGGPRKTYQKGVFISEMPIVEESRREIFNQELERLTGNSFMIGGILRGNALPWSVKSPPNYVERSHLLLGRTVDQGKVRDVISLMLFVEGDFDRQTKRRIEWRIVGYRQAGILAAYAALFEPSIKEVIVIDPPKSHKDGPHFLGILRVLDIPEALGLLAPTPLTIIGGKDAAFDRTAEIYRLAGAADKLTRK